MNKSLNLQPRTDVDFEKLVWKCHICKQDRSDKYLKVFHHDFSRLMDMPSGFMTLNVRYCTDMIGCGEKASNRVWVKENILKGKFNG